jgi:pyruvate formate-lyase activating enzyme-like uncharacterized protein
MVYTNIEKKRMASVGQAFDNGDWAIRTVEDLINSISLADAEGIELIPNDALMHIINSAIKMSREDLIPEYWKEKREVTELL